MIIMRLSLIFVTQKSNLYYGCLDYGTVSVARGVALDCDVMYNLPRDLALKKVFFV